MKDLKKFILITLFAFIVLIGIYGLYSSDYIAVSQTSKMVFRLCIIPIIILTLICAYFSSFGYPKNTLPKRKNALLFIIMSYICGMINFVSFQGILMLINSNTGYQKEYLLIGKILKTNYPKHKKPGAKYSIEILRETENDTIELNVPTNEFVVGRKFEKEMKIGSLNFIYK